MSFCEHCVKGVTHEGEPQGKWEEVNGVNYYIATPTTHFPKDKAILFITDLFEPQLINSRLLADDFAANGFKTVIPDIFNGDAAPADALNPGHGPEFTRPPIDKVLEGLKKSGVTSFAKAPILINSCTNDSQYPPAAAPQADEIFASFALGYKCEYFEGCTHGFAIRGDMGDPKVKVGKEGAFKATVEWMMKYL
ncbi:hypothetical protein GYMLUDRAFT_981895 [Collybiopsis luxurians FD-317 M1]|nr:hypothetical protein GYMLUDRAFT_981895 [Collybiopsis luxurians FD-317 M1]